jgi:hypothetical protein
VRAVWLLPNIPAEQFRIPAIQRQIIQWSGRTAICYCHIVGNGSNTSPAGVYFQHIPFGIVFDGLGTDRPKSCHFTLQIIIGAGYLGIGKVVWMLAQFFQQRELLVSFDFQTIFCAAAFFYNTALVI